MSDKFLKPKLRHITPCSECPWRRDHPAGWLGGYRPEQFVEQVQFDGPPLACHKTDSLDPPSMCAGALIFMRNSIKSSRHPAFGNALSRVTKDIEAVFQWPHEFIKYHQDPDGWAKRLRDKTTIAKS